MSKENILDIVNEDDVIIGQEEHKRVHKEGLLHREIHIWFVTPDGNLIFQHRAKDKDTYPDLLDATVGGHVDGGMSYDETAIKEMFEETGVVANPNDLYPLRRMRTSTVDEITGTKNNVFRFQYAYIFKGNIADLKTETGKSIGFEVWPLEKIFSLNDNDKRKLIPIIYSDGFIELFREVQKIIKKDNDKEKQK